MLDFLAQAATPPPVTFWTAPPYSQLSFTLIATAIALGFIIMFALMKAPTNLRRPIVLTVTFLAGLYWVMVFLFPTPIDFQPNEIPQGPGEVFGRWLQTTKPIVSDISQTLAALLLGLGTYGLIHLHLRRLARRGKDSFFSAVLLVSFIAMVVFGYWEYVIRLNNAQMVNELNPDMSNWPWQFLVNDFLFDGLLQQMEAVMFSMIAFFILSAGYRAFRIRSIEATVLMASALIVMLSLMGLVEFAISSRVDAMTGGDPAHFANNLKLTSIADWLKQYVQVPSLRAMDFGIGLGALAMGLRIWLGLEKGGVTTQ